MTKHKSETTLVLRIDGRAVRLTEVLQILEGAGVSVGKMEVVHYGEQSTVREFVVETTDEAHLARVLTLVGQVSGVTVMSSSDTALERHRGGKIRMRSLVELKGLSDYRSVYTPGVVRVVNAIVEQPLRAWKLTSMSNTVAVLTNGTHVLGMGSVGALASLPVMEAKAVIYDVFADISAVPILIDTHDPDKFIEAVIMLSKSFGGFHLEDIRPPACFIIEDALRARLGKPVMHDDQHGTAVTVLAAVISACRTVGVDPKSLRLGQVGVGASGSAIARIAMQYGMREVLVSELSQFALQPVVKRGARDATLEVLMRDADIVVATTGKQGLIKPEMIRPGHIIFALSNPEPEITPEQARAAGAAFAADGRTVNNALAYPGIFRGVLDTRCRTITHEMYVAVAETLAGLAPAGELLPNPLDRAVHDAVAETVRRKVREQGLDDTVRMDPAAKHA